jgi:hypothetical protein
MADAVGGKASDVPDDARLAVAGMAKVFVGEVVEEGACLVRTCVCPAPVAHSPAGAAPTALTLMAERNETGPLRAWHLREAYRRLDRRGGVRPGLPHARRRLVLRP